MGQSKSSTMAPPPENSARATDPTTSATPTAPAHLPLGGLHHARQALEHVAKQFEKFVLHEKEKHSKWPEFAAAEKAGIEKVALEHDVKKGELFVLDGNFSVADGKQIWENWGQSIPETALAPLPPGLSRFPTRLSEVQDIVQSLNAQYYAPGTDHTGPKPHLRVVGHGHSWTPIFADQTGDWVIFSREFAFDEGSNIEGAGLAPDGAPLVKVTAGTTTGELATWFQQEENYRAFGWEQPVGLSSDVIIDTVRYGGAIATGCHGTGWTCQTVSDMVYSISVVNHKGDLVVYDRNSEPALFNAARCSFGLLGVTYDLTLKLDAIKAAPLVMVNHSKPTQATYFGPSSGDALKQLVLSSYAVEFFWFPLDSYATHVHNYDPMQDRNWVKVFAKRVSASVSQSPNKLHDVTQTLTDWLKVNFGGEVNWWAYVCSNPFIMSTFSNFALSQLDDSQNNILPLAQAIHYQKSIDDFQVNDLEFCFKVDDDFENVKRAWVAVTEIVREYVADKSKGNPLSVAMECRFTAHSDIPLSPAYGKPGDHFCWMEVLSLKDQPNWEEFCDQVAERWIALGLNPKPHWAKWNAPKDPKKPDVCLDLAKKASAAEIAQFSSVVSKQDPQGMFQTTWLKNAFDLK